MMIEKLGVQLFSLPTLLEKSLAGAMHMLSDIGYSEIEMYGPYAFSHNSAKEQWESIIPMLGFSGSGLFGKTANEFSRYLQENSLQATSAHTDIYTLQNHMAELAEVAAVLGWQYVVLPMLPDEFRRDMDDYKKTADLFNLIGEKAKDKGLKFAYHNHGYGLHEQDGEVPLIVLLENTDPNLVFFELDVFWTTAGGVNPLDLLEDYPNRYQLLHLKDMQKAVRFSGDGSTPDQWFELMPYMTSAGDGVLDLKAIVNKAQNMGIQRFFVEQDMAADPETALARSAAFFKK